MAYAYWKSGTSSKEAVFHLFFRKNPFQCGFSVNCGLEDVIAYLNHFAFEESDLVYLAGLTGSDGQPLFDKEFVEYLRALRLTVDVDAVPEGTIVFPIRTVGAHSRTNHSRTDSRDRSA